MYISSISERSERIPWEGDSSESREEVVVELLRLDVEEEVSELSDSPSLVGTRRFSKDTSFRYLKSRARLKERSWSSNSSSSRRRSGMRGMNTNTTDNEHEVLVESSKMGRRLKNVGDADTCRQVADTKGTHYHAHYRHFHMRGVSKLTII